MVKGKQSLAGEASKRQSVKEEVKVNEEAEILKAQLARTLADYDNLVKRTQRDRSDLFRMASVGIINKLLPVLDNLENANLHLKDSGLAITIGEFEKILNEEGLTKIKPEVGSQFDENSMEAIEIVEGEVDNTISEVVLLGWKYLDLPAGRQGNTIIRHAKVKVVKVKGV